MNKYKQSKRQLSDREIHTLKMLGAAQSQESGRIWDDSDGFIKTGKIGFYGYEGVLVEVKATEKKSFSVTKDLLDKIYKQALQFTRMAILAINFDNKSYVVMRLEDFRDLLDWSLRDTLAMKELDK